MYGEGRRRNGPQIHVRFSFGHRVGFSLTCICIILGSRVEPQIRLSLTLNVPSHELRRSGHRMAHRKWKETKQQPSMLPCTTAVPGCSLVSFHFLWAILCPQAVPGSPSDLNAGNRIEGATGCPSWCRPLRPLFHFLCSNLKANPVH